MSVDPQSRNTGQTRFTGKSNGVPQENGRSDRHARRQPTNNSDLSDTSERDPSFPAYHDLFSDVTSSTAQDSSDGPKSRTASRPCKYGVNCWRKSTCKFDHSGTSSTTTSVGGPVSARDRARSAGKALKEATHRTRSTETDQSGGQVASNSSSSSQSSQSSSSSSSLFSSSSSSSSSVSSTLPAPPLSFSASSSASVSAAPSPPSKLFGRARHVLRIPQRGQNSTHSGDNSPPSTSATTSATSSSPTPLDGPMSRLGPALLQSWRSTLPPAAASSVASPSTHNDNNAGYNASSRPVPRPHLDWASEVCDKSPNEGEDHDHDHDHDHDQGHEEDEDNDGRSSRRDENHSGEDEHDDDDEEEDHSDYEHERRGGRSSRLLDRTLSQRELADSRTVQKHIAHLYEAEAQGLLEPDDVAQRVYNIMLQSEEAQSAKKSAKKEEVTLATLKPERAVELFTRSYCIVPMASSSLSLGSKTATGSAATAGAIGAVAAAGRGEGKEDSRLSSASEPEETGISLLETSSHPDTTNSTIRTATTTTTTTTTTATTDATTGVEKLSTISTTTLVSSTTTTTSSTSSSMLVLETVESKLSFAAPASFMIAAAGAFANPAQSRELEAETLCCFCLQDLEEGDSIMELPCSHVFHELEIREWLTNKSLTCPTCRHDIRGKEFNTKDEK